ncbi:hypothetical protein ACWIUD_06835 [Helicobacter sp. 23-1044]
MQKNPSLRDSANFRIFSVIARMDEVHSWQSILFFWMVASLRAPRNDEMRADSANFTESNFPLPCGGGLRGWVNFILNSAFFAESSEILSIISIKSAP